MESENKIYLLVPYEKKDELKKLYKIKWDAETKLWYIGEMVEGLKPYAIMKIQVEYGDKDLCKSKYKSMVEDIYYFYFGIRPGNYQKIECINNNKFDLNKNNLVLISIF